ncbi:glycosyltransferase family 4 protein [Leifsonia aquatica]|uniref:glycosyltransferase family 4 protein n=1 Tax=Leifsonia aquatica TaxID=144185 RepID=UPI0028ABC1B6|nr:glycosyltransferase family 4 protein [Leifsonia aquatica]
MHHVLFVVNNYAPSVGGVELHVAALARELVRAGHHATVVTLSAADSDSVEDGVRVIRVAQGPSIGGVFAFPRSGRLRGVLGGLRSAGITAVSTQTRFFPMTWRGRRFARTLDVPLIHTEHGSDFVRGVSLPVAAASRIVDLTLGRRALRASDRVLGVSERVTEFVGRLSGVRAAVFYNAIDLPPDLGVPARDQDFVFVGRLVPGKGADRAIEAFSALPESAAESKLIVLGDGPMRAELEALATAKGVGERVEFTGRVPSGEVFSWLRGNILVNPSTLAEGFQTTLIEAAASGAQIVSYDLAGVAALEAAHAPIRIVTEPDAQALAQAMLEARDSPLPVWAREDAHAWSWPARAADYVKVLDGTRAGGSAPA